MDEKLKLITLTTAKRMAKIMLEKDQPNITKNALYSVICEIKQLPSFKDLDTGDLLTFCQDLINA